MAAGGSGGLWLVYHNIVHFSFGFLLDCPYVENVNATGQCIDVLP